MNTTFRIAKLELNTLFYSPIAWFLSIVFLFQCGLFYTSAIQDLFTNQQIGGWQLQMLNFSTNTIFGFERGLFGDVLKKVYLYLPLLTMGLISREISSGTIKLLYSSPVKIKEIILGKFVAMMAYNFLLILMLLIFVITGAFNIQHLEYGAVFAGLLGIYLLLCTYAAIGLFMSCLTSYQVVAAISTLVIFAVLNYIGKVWQGIDFVRDLTNFLSISRRAERMIFGLISTNDIMYFVLIICTFLGFSYTRLQSGRESKSVFYVGGKYVAIFLVTLFVGYLTALPGFIGYYDATDTKRNTLTPNAQKILKDLGDEPLEVTSYINLVDQRWATGKPDQRNNIMSAWESYLRFKSNINFKFVYYWDEPTPAPYEYYPGKSLKQIAQQFAQSWKVDFEDFKTPEEMKKIINLKPEQNRFVMQLKYKGKTTFLRLFDDPAIWPSETEVSAAFKRLTAKLPKIVFVQGEFERSMSKTGDKSYGVLVSMIANRNALVNQGFDTDTIALQTQEIPSDLTALVIADPRTDFSPVALAKIQKYIDEGGNLLIAGEPGKQDVLNPVLKPLGVQFMDGMLVQKNKDELPNLVKPLLTVAGTALGEELKYYYEGKDGVRMKDAVGIKVLDSSPFKITPFLMTDASVSWNKIGKVVVDSADVVFSPESGDQKVAIPTLVGLTRNIKGQEQRIIVSGDADFISTVEMMRGMTANTTISAPLFGWFTYGAFPINTARPGSEDKQLNLTSKGVSMMKIFFMGVLPGLLLILATVFLIRRKRK